MKGDNMTGSLLRQQTPEELELELKQAELLALEAEFAEKELTHATMLGELRHFEQRYFGKVGTLYATLDELEAKIAELVAARHPNNKRAQKNAEEARAKAMQSADETALLNATNTTDAQFNPSDTLKALYRAAAKSIHPDLAKDDADRALRHKAMTAVNEAYEKEDENRLRLLIEEWQTNPEAVKGEGAAAELIRVIRRIALIRRRLVVVGEELKQLRNNFLALLKNKVDAALARGRDLLDEMAANLQLEIEEAKTRIEQLRQQDTSEG